LSPVLSGEISSKTFGDIVGRLSGSSTVDGASSARSPPSLVPSAESGLNTLTAALLINPHNPSSPITAFPITATASLISSPLPRFSATNSLKVDIGGLSTYLSANANSTTASRRPNLNDTLLLAGYRINLRPYAPRFFSLRYLFRTAYIVSSMHREIQIPDKLFFGCMELTRHTPRLPLMKASGAPIDQVKLHTDVYSEVSEK